MNPTYFQQRHQPGQMAAFFLGAGPMPPPTQQEIAVAMANQILNNATPEPANVGNDDADENIDPELRSQTIPESYQPQLSNFCEIARRSLIIHLLSQISS